MTNSVMNMTDQAVQSTGGSLRRRNASVSRSTQKEVKHEIERAIVAGARVHGRAYITSQSLSELRLLALEEADLVSRDPFQAERAACLVDSFVLGCAREITSY